MEKSFNRLLSVFLVALIVLLSAPLNESLHLKGLLGGASLTAYASNNYEHNVSYNPVENNYDSGGFPSGLSYCYENEIIYFNFSAGTDGRGRRT